MTLLGVGVSRIAPWLLERLKDAAGSFGELALKICAVVWLCDLLGFLCDTLGLASGVASGGLLDSGPEHVRELVRRRGELALSAFGERLDPGVGACWRGCS